MNQCRVLNDATSQYLTLMAPDKDKKLLTLILLLAETWRSASIPSKGMRGD
jgi:hypothetical protein